MKITYVSPDLDVLKIEDLSTSLCEGSVGVEDYKEVETDWS